MVVGVQKPGSQVGLGPIPVGGSRGHTQVHPVPVFTGFLMNQCDAFQIERVGDTFYAGVVGWILAGLLHPVSKADRATGLRCGLGVDEQFEVGLRAKGGQCGHGEVEFGERGLHVADSLVDGLAFLKEFNAPFAHELRGGDEPLQVHPAVLDRELVV